MSIGHLYVLFGEVSVQVLCSFFNGVVYLVWGSDVRWLNIFQDIT